MIIQDNDPYTEPSFSLGNRVARFAWGIVWALFFCTTPRFLHGWRNFLLRLFGAKIGCHVHIYPTVKIWAPWNFIVGDFVGIGNQVNVYCMAPIQIGNYAVISQGVHLCAGSHDFNRGNFQLITAPISIGDRSWICADAFVGLGVSVAEGVVLGARSLTSKSIVEGWTVWAGIPAKKIGIRDRNAVLSLQHDTAKSMGASDVVG